MDLAYPGSGSGSTLPMLPSADLDVGAIKCTKICCLAAILKFFRKLHTLVYFEATLTFSAMAKPRI
jgi:hypothetical protein